ncbi:MAG TPA: signal peptidase I [Candidatus Dojkabacteria bacterium]|nr:signal peptidase I [Candidatus Dojkabacteria bacterium]
MRFFKILKNFPKALIILLGLFIISAFFLLPRLGYTLLVVQSGSMEPAVRPGSVMLVKSQENPEEKNKKVAGIAFDGTVTAQAVGSALYNPGDIITFQANNTLVSHRVVSVNNSGGEVSYVTKGDANQSADGNAVPESRVLGRAVFSLPVAWKFVNFAKTPAGFLMLIAIPSLYIILSEVLAIIKELRKRHALLQVRHTGFKPDFKLALNVFVMIFTALFSLSSTFALFSDTASSTGNTFTAAEFFTPPEPGEVFLDQVVSIGLVSGATGVNGMGTFGHCCNANDLSSDLAVAQALVTGAPDVPPTINFIQISNNTVMVFKFVNNKAVDSTGADIRIYTVDEDFPGTANIAVAQGPDCTTASYISLGDFSDTGNIPNSSDVELEISGTELSSVQCIRITDLVDAGDPFPLLGFDLDAIEALHSVAVP